MRKHCVLLKVLLLSCICLVISVKSVASAPLDGIAAIVNDQVISISKLHQRMLTVKDQLQQRSIKLPPDNVLNKQVLQMMINETLQQQIVKRLNITASAADVSNALHIIATQQKTSIPQLYQSLSQHGMSKNQFINQIKQQIINEKLMHIALDTQIKVSPQEIDAYIKMLQAQQSVKNEFHLLHILIPMQNSPTPTQIATATKKAQKIIKALKQGKDFKTLVTAASSDPQAFSGDDMGWKTLAALPAVFTNQVLTMKTGDVAGPIRTSNGLHIIKLVGMRDKKLNSNINMAQQRQRVGNMILQQKLAEKQQAWLQKLRATAYIKILYP